MKVVVLCGGLGFADAGIFRGRGPAISLEQPRIKLEEARKINQ
jgi:hypothetical protein